MSMLLAIDIGNSTIGIGLFPDTAASNKLFIRKIPTHPAVTSRKYKKIIAELIKGSVFQDNPEGFSIRNFGKEYSLDAIVSSVVPYLNKPAIESLKSLCRKKPLVVSDKITSGLSFDVKQPGEIGADRIANAVAGFHHARKAVAVVDFGTATTITVVGRNMNFLGGAIMPGIHLMQKSLHRETAKLPIVPLKKNSRALGKDTASSITSGIIHGTAGAVETIIKNMEKELDFKLQLVLTGGNAKFMSSLLKRNYDLVPNLTFEGLRLIYLKNRKELQDHA